MSLDITLLKRMPIEVYFANITHNLSEMARVAGIHKYLWRAEENRITKARQLISPLKKAIFDMEANPEKYKKYNSANGWGLYENFVPWLVNLLHACENHPDATISTDR